MKLLIRGGRVVDPSLGIDGPMEVLIEDGHIVQLAEKAKGIRGAEVFDAKGLVVTPGWIDMHVHLREPGQEYKETVRTGALAAANGGFTAIACMPNTKPVIDNRSITEHVMSESRKNPYARVYPIGAVSKGQKGEELAEIGDMVEAGVVAVTDDGLPIRNAELMRRALLYTQHFDIPVIQHAQDLDLSRGGVMHEGEWSTRLGLIGIPGAAEDVMVARDLILTEDTGGKYHLAHMSTARSLDMIRNAKARGQRVTCEVTPHHLLLTDRSVAETSFSTSTKMNPPLRAAEDREAMINGLADGSIDAIASDHAPHHKDEKDLEFSLAPFGIIGLETNMSLCLDQLVRPGHITLSRLVELFSTAPARILNLPGGTLAEGAPADLTLFSLTRTITVRAARFRSKAVNTPFEGWKLRGRPVATVLAGRVLQDLPKT